MDVEVHSSNLVSEFMAGDIVFKITAIKAGDIEGVSRDIGMVTTKDDYEQKLCSHQYNPLLFLVDFYQQLAYLYGCLNHKFHKPRDSDFFFWWRKIRTKEWKPWFTVTHYEESMGGRQEKT